MFDAYGSPEDNRGYDKAQAFVVRLQRSGSRSEDRLLGLLSTIFVSNLTSVEKKSFYPRYNIPVGEHMERMVANMCNYSSYVFNKGIQQGIIQGMLAAGENRHFESSENRHFQFN